MEPIEGVSLAAMTAISSRLKDSSDSVVFIDYSNDSVRESQISLHNLYSYYTECAAKIGTASLVVSLAAMIAISSRLKDLSDNFDFGDYAKVSKAV